MIIVIIHHKNNKATNKDRRGPPASSGACLHLCNRPIDHKARGQLQQHRSGPDYPGPSIWTAALHTSRVDSNASVVNLQLHKSWCRSGETRREEEGPASQFHCTFLHPTEESAKKKNPKNPKISKRKRGGLDVNGTCSVLSI